MRKKYRSYFFTISLLFLLLQCSQPVSNGGNSSETVIGKVMQEDGSPACSTVVILYPDDYDPIGDIGYQLHSDTTDSGGSYKIVIDAGDSGYSIVAKKSSTHTSALITGVTLTDNTTHIKNAILSKPGSISINMPENFNNTNYLYIPGTGISVRLKSERTITINEVPTGTNLSINYISNESSAINGILSSGIIVVSNETTIIPYPQWKHFRKIYLNTTSSGVSITSNVTNFPALVRLSDVNFTFSEAKTDGSDIRFTKQNGDPLPFEIESWDLTNKIAVIWVKIDTVYENSSSQFITMHWGMSDAVSVSDGKDVFDTADGFSGVWHLGESEGKMISDQTSNAFNGTSIMTSAVKGIIGAAQKFDGVSSKISISGSATQNLNFPENGSFSVSAWVKVSKLDSLFRGIVYKSNLEYGLQLRPENQWEFLNFINKSRWEMSRAPAIADTWQYLVGVRKGSSQYLYVNGISIDSSIFKLDLNTARATDQPLEIGHCLDGGLDPDRFFNGIIDEVRIEGIAHDSNWIKLCYMNQKENDDLLEW